MPVILKVLEGPDAGTTVLLSNGENVVGTGSRALMRLTTETASVEHFVVTQDNDALTIENLSARGTLINDVKITGKVRLRLRDKIRVSDDTVIRVETEGGDSIITQYRSLVIALIACVIIIGLLMLIFDPFSTPPQKANWDRTQIALSKSVETNKKYRSDVKRSWSAAWNKDKNAKSSNDFKMAAQEWLALQIALQQYEFHKLERAEDVDANSERFSQLLRNPRAEEYVEDPEHDIGPLILEFVTRRYDLAMKKAEQKQGLLE